MLTLGFQSNNYEGLRCLFGRLYRNALPDKKQCVEKKPNWNSGPYNAMWCNMAPVKTFRNGQRNISLFQTVVIYEDMYFWQHWRMSFIKGVANSIHFGKYSHWKPYDKNFFHSSTVEFIYKIKTAVPCQTTLWQQITIENFICERYLYFFCTQKGIQLNAGFSIEAAEWVIKQ